MDSPYRQVLFVTGRLAEPALRRALDGFDAPFAKHVAVMKITVAALMTTEWIARFLDVPEGTDLIVLPGLVEGDVGVLETKFGVPVRKGPKDLREIPRFFGRELAPLDYGAYTIEILAEINNAPKLPLPELVRLAERYRADGADLIDVGCTPGVPFPHLGDVVRELGALGLRVSIDSFEPAEIRAGIEAGADTVLSVNGSNLPVAETYAGGDIRFVAIPDFGQGLDTLDRTLEQLDRWRVPVLADPIVEPIGFGFMRSLERYAEVRRRYPDVPQMMGIGNITELTAADSTGVNAILIAICEELGVRAVLTTEVINWARGSVKEIDIARRLMHFAVREQRLPKNVDDRLVTLKDPRVLQYTVDELREIQRSVKDRNFRIFADREAITVFNRDLFVRGTVIQEIFDQLGVDDAGHAFYLGKELARAQLAVQLGKSYRQEGALQWGYLTPEDDPNREHLRLGTAGGTTASAAVPAAAAESLPGADA